MQKPFDVLMREARGTRSLGAARNAGPARRGITLIELLVVISIMMLLAAMAIPAVRPALEGRRIREAARAINVYLSTAKSKAMLDGRPCGVIFERVEGLPQCSMVLQQAIVPPPYAGDEIGSAARLQIVDASVRVPVVFGGFGICVDAQMLGSFTPKLVHYGDRIQINAQGPWYTVVGPDTDNNTEIDNTITTTITATPVPLELEFDSSGGEVPWPYSDKDPLTTTDWSSALPYQILRQPIKSSAKPLQLPAGAVVDLAASGTDDLPLGGHGTVASIGPDAHAPVMIMFSPNGSVERMIYVPFDRINNKFLPKTDPLATRPIHLLIGKRERVTTEADPATTLEDDLPNWTDLTNLWVTINPQTGLVSTAENSFVDFSGITWTDPTDVWPHILRARAFARESKSMGGR